MQDTCPVYSLLGRAIASGIQSIERPGWCYTMSQMFRVLNPIPHPLLAKFKQITPGKYICIFMGCKK